MIKIRLTNHEGEYEQGQAQLPSGQLSFLQSYGYGQMQARLGNEPVYLLAEDENGVIKGSYMAILFKAKRGRFFFLPYITVNHGDWEMLLDYLKCLGKSMKVDFIRISPLLDNTPENKRYFIRYGFRDAPIHMMHPEIRWQLDLNKPEKQLLKGMRKNTRYAIKQAEKAGITIVSGHSMELLDKFYEIHRETVKRQHFIPYPHSYLQAQMDIFGPLDQIKVYLAEYEGKVIAAAIIMFYGQEASYHHGASLSEYNKIPASHLIQWEAIKEAQKRCFPRYDFWGIVENAPKHPWAGLSFFKQGFGGAGRYLLHCQDLPLTAKYWLNFFVETARRIKRGY